MSKLSGFEDLPKPLDEAAFLERVIAGYNQGWGEDGLPADLDSARSIIPAGTGAFRDFSYIAPEIPRFAQANCVACMDCVNICPDTAILAKVTPEPEYEAALAALPEGPAREAYRAHFTKHAKYYNAPKAKGKPGGYFSIVIDPTKCKGCAECVLICGEKNALAMQVKDAEILEEARSSFAHWRKLPDTPEDYLTKAPGDMMLTERSQLFVGGAGSCMGCGEASAIRMALAATGFVHGKQSMGVVASTGCNSVYSSTYPFNPFLTPWTNSLFENAPTYAMGIRMKWDQHGWADKKLWVIGGDGAMNDIGFQALSRLLMSGMDIKVLVLDTQVYSNTGGQASTASFTAQNAKMSLHGKVLHGKTEYRKELANIAMMHPNVYVAQTICGNQNHFYRAVLGAIEFKGPALINVFTTCQPEHQVADDVAFKQAKLAADCRVFPLFIYDPRKGEKIAERLSLQGNVGVDKDFYSNPKTGEVMDFITFARTEGRFSKHFDKDGKPSPELEAANHDRLHNWHLLQELAGLR